MEEDMDGSPERAVGKRACVLQAIIEQVSNSCSEKKIDGLDNRLTNIENVLANIASKLESNQTSAFPGEWVGQVRTPLSRHSDRIAPEPDVKTPVHFEGETGINTQSDYVRDLLVQVVGETPLVGQNAEVKAALKALGELVTRHNHDIASTTSLNQPLLDRSLASIDSGTVAQPPWEVVRFALDKALKHPTMMFANLFSMLKMKNLCEIIEDAYFRPATCGTARRLLAYGVLFNIFTEFSIAPWSGIDRKTLTEYASLAKIHLEVAISQLDMFLPASYENIIALSVGIACAIEMCRPSLAWILVSNAAELCQNLGYHRFETMKHDTRQEQRSKMHIFWMICMFEKQLSLRLGRASRIQDWDVSLPLLAVRETSPNGFEGSDMLIYWVKVAKVSGQIYEKLFSPAAFRKPFEERTRIAAALVKAMNQAWSERGQESIMDFSNALSPNETEVPSKRKRLRNEGNQAALEPDAYMQSSFDRVEDAFFHADVVMHYSTCALIQRATSPDNSTFSQECLGYSRAALVAHMRSNAQFNTNENAELWAGYVHWSILQAPITPWDNPPHININTLIDLNRFMVLFSNAISKADPTDLKSLTEFVTSLESCRAVSEGAEKLYKMCLLFLKVAGFYIQAKNQERQTAQMSFSGSGPSYTNTAAAGTPIDLSTVAQFGPHLSALGFVSNTAWSSAGYDSGLATEGQGFYAPDLGLSNAMGFDGSGVSYETMGASHNSIQEWFAGSRYLNNFMDVGNDLQMPDFNDIEL
ncbi:fungal specific transcription factor domain protein [Stagonosporopsis vannaccii]|nr:fungal specific transcription factor domain protein [Stagonosporopsis vannaccii]